MKEPEFFVLTEDHTYLWSRTRLKASLPTSCFLSTCRFLFQHLYTNDVRDQERNTRLNSYPTRILACLYNRRGVATRLEEYIKFWARSRQRVQIPLSKHKTLERCLKKKRAALTPGDRWLSCACLSYLGDRSRWPALSLLFSHISGKRRAVLRKTQ